MANTRVAGEPRVWDARHQLSAGTRAALEAQLITAERKTGVPIYLFLTDRLHGQTAADLARDAFAEHRLGADPARNAVLLVVAAGAGAAAVETGKGSAGIVPEIDARRIVKELTASLPSRHPERAIAHALTQLTSSARATAARRTPLPSPPPERDDPDAATVPASGAGEELADGGRVAGPDGDAENANPVLAGGSAAPGADAGGTPQPGGEIPKRAGRSRLPIAVGLGVLVLVGLALRRRRQVAASRPTTEAGGDGKRPRPRF